MVMWVCEALEVNNWTVFDSLDPSSQVKVKKPLLGWTDRGPTKRKQNQKYKKTTYIQLCETQIEALKYYWILEQRMSLDTRLYDELREDVMIWVLETRIFESDQSELQSVVPTFLYGSMTWGDSLLTQGYTCIYVKSNVCAYTATNNKLNKTPCECVKI